MADPDKATLVCTNCGFTVEINADWAARKPAARCPICTRRMTAKDAVQGAAAGTVAPSEKLVDHTIVETRAEGLATEAAPAAKKKAR